MCIRNTEEAEISWYSSLNESRREGRPGSVLKRVKNGGDDLTTLESEFIKATSEEWVDLSTQPYLNETTGNQSQGTLHK